MPTEIFIQISLFNSTALTQSHYNYRPWRGLLRLTNSTGVGMPFSLSPPLDQLPFRKWIFAGDVEII